jgi:hypothetical protein
MGKRVRRRDRAVVVTLVGAGHAVVLGYLAYAHRDPPMGDNHPITVTLVDRQPPARPSRKTPSRDRRRSAPVATAPPPPPVLSQPAPTASAAELNAAPFLPGRRRAPPDEAAAAERARENCERDWKALGYPGPSRCDSVLARQGGYDPDRTEDGPGFAREARRKVALRRYRETTDPETYPGILCTIFHKC